MARLAVVILNWNGAKLLEEFLPSVVKNNSPQADIFVADNHSGDDSVNFVQKNFPSVKIVSNPENGGFAKGYNDALKQISGYEYFCLLNSDVEVSPGWIDPILSMMDADMTIAAAQPKILSYRNKKQFEYAGAAGGFIDKYGFPFCRGRLFNTFENDEGQYDDVKEIFWATGACLFIRAKLYWEAGALDEDFFAHMEEIDLCWRLKNMGYKVMYNYRSVVYHLGGATLSKLNPHKTYLNFRNNLVLLFKNHSSRFFIIKMMLRMMLDGIAGIKFLFGLEFRHFWAVLHAHFSFYMMIRKTMRKRKEQKKKIKSYSTTAIYNHSLVLSYFLKGKKKFSDLDGSAFK